MKVTPSQPTPFPLFSRRAGLLSPLRGHHDSARSPHCSPRDTGEACGDGAIPNGDEEGCDDCSEVDAAACRPECFRRRCSLELRGHHAEFLAAPRGSLRVKKSSLHTLPRAYNDSLNSSVGSAVFFSPSHRPPAYLPPTSRLPPAYLPPTSHQPHACLAPASLAHHGNLAAVLHAHVMLGLVHDRALCPAPHPLSAPPHRTIITSAVT
eukprot:3149500-Rhodomonas_salina.1